MTDPTTTTVTLEQFAAYLDQLGAILDRYERLRRRAAARRSLLNLITRPLGPSADLMAAAWARDRQRYAATRARLTRRRDQEIRRAGYAGGLHLDPL